MSEGVPAKALLRDGATVTGHVVGDRFVTVHYRLTYWQDTGGETREHRTSECGDNEALALDLYRHSLRMGESPVLEKREVTPWVIVKGKASK